MKMKQIVFIALILFLGNNLKAQIATNTEAPDSTNIYYQSFKKYCEQINKKTDLLLVEENNFITKSLPEELGGQKIKVVNVVELQKLLKDKKQVQLLRLIPLRMKDGDFFVNIIVFNVAVKRKHFDFINEGGISVVYSYDTEHKTFIFKDVK